jgi:hypothetical protein
MGSLQKEEAMFLIVKIDIYLDIDYYSKRQKYLPFRNCEDIKGACYDI